MTTPRRLFTSIALCGALSRAGVAAAQSRDYADAFATAAEREHAGQFRAAAEALAPLRAAYPDDYAVALQMGWLAYRAGDDTAARAHYAHALALSAGSSTEARLGLAWTLFRQGNRARAEREFERVLRRAPANAAALEGLALARRAPAPAVRAWPSLWLGGSLYGNHPDRRGAASLTAGLGLQFADLVLVEGTYRALGYDYGAGASPGVLPYAQHEIFVALGIARPGYALRLHLGHVWDADDPRVPAYAAGLSLRAAAHGELAVEASGTVYTDYAALRVGATWDVAVSEAFTLGPAVALQYGNGAVGGALGLRVGLQHRGYALALAARYGDEQRPTYLNQSITYATNDHIRAALSATGRVPLGHGLALTLGYEWQRLAVDHNVSPTEADAHYLTTGLSASW